MDLTSPRVIRSVQDKFGFTFKKGLGQNFLTSREALGKIVDSLGGERYALEIGPGFGTLTAALAERMDKVVAVETDERLIPVLEYTLAGHDNVEIIHGDVMKLDINELIREKFGARASVAANLPYYITTPVITMLLESRAPLNNITLMVQKEVARRITASPASKDYGAITLLCDYYAETSIAAYLSASSFVPPPKVDSAVLKFAMRSAPAVRVLDEKMLFKVIRASFAQRRKTLLNCLCAAFPVSKTDMSSLLERAVSDPSRRGETLSLAEFARIADELTNLI